jgi:methyl-accepting chemotaxis protein
MTNWILNLKIGSKLGISFTLLLLLAVAVGGSALSRMTQMNGRTQEISAHSLPGTAAIADMLNHIKQLHILEWRRVLTPDEAGKVKVDEEMQARLGLIAAALGAYEKTLLYTEDRRNFDDLKARWAACLNDHQTLQELNKGNDLLKLSTFMQGQSSTDFQALDETLTRMVTWNKAHGAALAREADHSYATARLVMLLLLIVAVTVGGWLGYRVTQSIARPINRLSSIAEELAIGDIEQQIEIVGTDEVGRLAESFRAMLVYQTEVAVAAAAIAEGDLKTNFEPKCERDALGTSFATMITNLRLLIGAVSTNTDEVADTSQRLAETIAQTEQAAYQIAQSIQTVANAAGTSAATSQEIAVGSENQARSVIEIAHNMQQLQEMSGQVQQDTARQLQATLQAGDGARQAAVAVEQVARSARQMAHSAHEAARIAQTGGQSVQETIRSMGRIQTQVQTVAGRIQALGRKGQEIGAIVQTIEQIAEQTNLLALNAAIEAARAGEHGKGFAVVADEVRKLAERATTATQEISSLIGEVRGEVNEAVSAMETSSAEVSGGVGRSEEAGRGLEQILHAVNSVTGDTEGLNAITAQMTQSVNGILTSIEAIRTMSEQSEQTAGRMAQCSGEVAYAVSTVASISEETAAGALEMSGSAQQTSGHAQQMSETIAEQTRNISEVNDAANRLNAMAQQTRQLVMRFQNFRWDRRENESAEARLRFQNRRTMTIQEAAEQVWLKDGAEAKRVPAGKRKIAA